MEEAARAQRAQRRAEEERERAAKEAERRAKRGRAGEEGSEGGGQSREQLEPDTKRARLLTGADQLVRAVQEHERLLMKGAWDSAWALLGYTEMPETASAGRKAYAKLLVKIHPDKQRGDSGLDAEEYTKATQWVTTWMQQSC